MEKFIWFRDLIINWIKKFLLKETYKRLFGAAIGGVKGYLIQWVFDKLWVRYIHPTIKLIFRKSYMVYRKWKTNRKIKKFKEAEGEQDVKDSFDDLP